MTSSEDAASTLKYDKGERRFKHVDQGTDPEIRFYKDDPKRWVGLCPAGMSAELRVKLLNEAVPEPAGDRDTAYVRSLFVVHQGSIYRAMTSDAGTTYHGFP